MKIEIEIPDEELKVMVAENLSERIAQHMYNGWREGYVYRKEIKEVVREFIKKDIENLSDKRGMVNDSKAIHESCQKSG